MATRTFPFVSQTRRIARAEGLAEVRATGRAEGLAEAILANLSNRDIEVDGDSQERIKSCVDADVLKAWLRRSLTVTSVADLLAE